MLVLCVGYSANFKMSISKFMAFISKSIFLIAALFLFSCSNERITYTLMYSPDEPIGDISAAIELILEREMNVEINRVISDGSIANLENLRSGKAEIAIVENFIPFEDSIKTVLRLYPQILHIFYIADAPIYSIQELFYDKEVFIGLEGSGSYRFMMLLFEYFGLDKSRINITDNAYVNEVIAGFIDILHPDQIEALESFRIFSFDKVASFGAGSVVEGISLRYPQVHPFVIPAKTYGTLTSEPVVTLATDALLVVRSSMRETPVYEITRAIFNEKQELTKISPLIQRGLSETFDRSELSFPLHEGARIYLDRDEPGLFERYAELIGVLFSIAVALASGLYSLSKWHNQRKKDRIDIFYRQLMKVKNAITKINTSKEGIMKIKEIHDAQNNAFDMLINEELEANESFRIYMELAKETINEVKDRVRLLKAHQR